MANLFFLRKSPLSPIPHFLEALFPFRTAMEFHFFLALPSLLRFPLVLLMFFLFLPLEFFLGCRLYPFFIFYRFFVPLFLCPFVDSPSNETKPLFPCFTKFFGVYTNVLPPSMRWFGPRVMPLAPDPKPIRLIRYFLTKVSHFL